MQDPCRWNLKYLRISNAFFLFANISRKVRKSYFRMAAKYHPDKNPDGYDPYTTTEEQTIEYVFN